jgi:hypothetical protein
MDGVEDSFDSEINGHKKNVVVLAIPDLAETFDGSSRLWVDRGQTPFPRPPVRPNGSFRGLPQKANS